MIPQSSSANSHAGTAPGGTTPTNPVSGSVDRAKTATTMRKHSVTVAGHRTSISLEQAFWEAFQTLARKQNKSLNKLIAEIDANRSSNLSSAIRVYILEHRQLLDN